MKSYAELQSDSSKQALVISKKFQDAYRLHVLPVIKTVHKEFLADDEGSLLDAESNIEKELKLSKGLNELAENLSKLVLKIHKEQPNLNL